MNHRRSAGSVLEAVESRTLFSVIYVDGEAGSSDINDGTSWAHAYLDLQVALSTATAGDEIRVADGKYVADDEGGGPSFVLPADVTVQGGYAGLGASDPDARDPHKTPSVLKNLIDSYDIPVVAAPNGESNAVFDGFTVVSFGFNGVCFQADGSSAIIRNCTFNGGMGVRANQGNLTINNCMFAGCDGIDGGGITLDSSTAIVNDSTFTQCFGRLGGAVNSYSSSLTANRCTFTGIQAAHMGQVIYSKLADASFVGCSFKDNGEDYESGGAIYGDGGNWSFDRCTFENNRADRGGALLIFADSLDIQNSHFIRNHAQIWGSAIFVVGPMNIANTIFEGNTSYYSGAIDASGGAIQMTNCLFAGNEASTGGTGAAMALTDATATLTNCTIGGNRSGNTGGGIWLSSSTLKLQNTIVSNNSAEHDGDQIYISPTGTSLLSFDHSYVENPYGPIRIFLRLPDPGADGLFGSEDDDYGDLRVFATGYSNPIIDAGDNSLLPAGVTTDIAGNPRFVDAAGGGAIVDVGAYEYQLPLRAVSGAFRCDAPRPTVSITFNGDLKYRDDLTADDLILLDPATNSPIPNLPTPTVSYDVQTRSASWVFPSLPDGRYHAKILSGTIHEISGSPLADDFSFDFFVLAGDANRDCRIDAADLQILSANWQGTGKTFSQGDFNYDGLVDISDLYILSSKWNQVLPPPTAPISTLLRPSRRTAVKIAGLV